MRRVHYEEITCKSALNRVKGMPFKWSLNPYKGCVHGCHYCFARRFHSYLDLNTGSDWTSVIFAKVNVAWVLRRELQRPSWKQEEVAVGTATDPYQPIEGKHQLTRQCLIAFADAHSPISLVTKGTMIVRDQDILAEISETAGCTVVFSITTLDRNLWRKIEPGTKEHFLGFLEDEYPQLLAEYRRLYPGAYAPKRFQWQIRDRVSQIKRETGLKDRRPGPTKAPRQLALSL